MYPTVLAIIPSFYINILITTILVLEIFELLYQMANPLLLWLLLAGLMVNSSEYLTLLPYVQVF